MPTLDKTHRHLYDETLYNLKVVVKETGLKPDTIRAWERRYGLPSPKRSKGGHRLYCRRDIEMLKWLIARQEEGLSISRAVHLWRQSLQEGDDLFAAPQTVTDTDSLEMLQQKWVEACLHFDQAKAQEIINEAFALYAPERVASLFFQQGLQIIGDGWYAGNITIQQEHFVSALVSRRLEAWVQSAPPPTNPEKIVVACAPEEQHSIGNLFITLLLKRRGWNVICLGANVPFLQMADTVSTIAPDLLILSAQRLHTAGNLLEMANMLNTSPTRVAFGGEIFLAYPQLIEKVPGSYLGNSLEEVPYMVAKILSKPHQPMPAFTPSTQHQQLLSMFREQKPTINTNMWKSLQDTGINSDNLFISTRSITESIEAALKFDDLQLIKHDIEWTRGLLTNRHIALAQLEQFLSVYACILQQAFGDHTTELTTLLGTLAKQ